jgi:hypothetical protein
MLMQILLHTPRWVFGLFAVLLALGLSQLAGRQAGLRKVSILPLAMLGLSFYGVVSAFAEHPWAVLGWLVALAGAVAAVSSRPLPQGTAYEPTTRLFALPGSAVPLALMMSIFFTKYAVGVAMSLSPGLAQHAGFAWTISALYGALSGVFLGRAVRLWRLALPTFGQAPAAAGMALR